MTATQSDLAALSRFVFRAPNWYSSVTFALVLAAVTGVGAFDSRFVLDDAYRGVFFIGVPTVAAGMLTSPIDRLLGGQLTYNRSSLLALTCEVIVVVWLTVAGVLALLTPLGQHFVFDALFASLAFVFAFRLFVVMAVSQRRALVAAVPASLQTATAALLLFVYSGTLRYFEFGGPILSAYLSRPDKAPLELLVIVPSDFANLAGMCLLYSVAVWGFLAVIDRPWRRSLGVSALDFLRGFVGHIAEGSTELEEFFESIGEEAVVPVTVLSIRRRNGREKARFVLPMIHPGPMGTIGGGNLPERVAAATEGLAFPPHATAGHDFNLVTEREVDVLLEAAERARDSIAFRDTASRSRRLDGAEVSILGQAFGEDALLVATYAPHFTDDVDFGVGLSAKAEARAGGLDDVLLVDAHNSNNGLRGDDLGHVVPGSRRALDMLETAHRIAEALATAPRDELSVGTAWDPTPWTPQEGVGPLGVRVAVFTVDDQSTAYVLVDGNNMEPGLRDELVGAILDGTAIDDAEVMTTDTHIVNTVQSTNQIGEAIDPAELRSLVLALVGEALDDREPVEAGIATEHATVTVFGNDRTETLASHANAVIAMGGALAAAVILATMAVSVLIFIFA